jgi:hypothetical protein
MKDHLFCLSNSIFYHHFSFPSGPIQLLDAFLLVDLQCTANLAVLNPFSWRISVMMTRNRTLLYVFTFVLLVFAGCGSSSNAPSKAETGPQASEATPTAVPTLVSTSTGEPTQASTPTPTAIPQPMPTSPPAPPSSPAPAILDLKPASMSIVGHLDCNKNGVYVCFARVLSGASNQSPLPWRAFTNVPGGIVFSPASGVLAPGQSVLVTISVPFASCTRGLFFFQGPVNTHTITWAC